MTPKLEPKKAELLELYNRLVEDGKSWNKRDDEFTLKEFMRDTGMGNKTAARYLDEKIKQGLIADRKVGTARYYHPIEVSK